MGEIVAKSRFVSDVNESNVIELRVAATGVKRGLFPACDERESKFRTSESSKANQTIAKKKEEGKKEGMKNADRRKSRRSCDKMRCSRGRENQIFRLKNLKKRI